MQDFDTRISALLNWIDQDKSKSYISPKVHVKNTIGSGRGLYAQESVAANENIVCIPPLLLLNFTTATAHISSYNDDITLDAQYPNIHVPVPVKDNVSRFYSQLSLSSIEELLSFQLISMFLVLERSRGHVSYWKPFIDMLPDISELELAPIVWKVLQLDNCDALWRMLPRSARKHADLVVARFDKDYAVINELTEKYKVSISKKDFLWAWMCINSRCLYMEIPKGKDATDNFTLAPYVDFLNHLSDDQCGIKIDTGGFHVVTSCKYSPGDELYFSYGPHSNEFLLCEYGFLLRENTWNYIDVSDFIIPLFRPNHVDFLKNAGYYGEYTVNRDGMSFRTEVALAVVQEANPTESRRLAAFIDGVSDGLVYSGKLNILLSKILQKLLGDCLRKLDDNTQYDKDTQRRISAVHALYLDIQIIAKEVSEV